MTNGFRVHGQCTASIETSLFEKPRLSPKGQPGSPRQAKLAGHDAEPARRERYQQLKFPNPPRCSMAHS
jgi:hypothetical protein